MFSGTTTTRDSEAGFRVGESRDVDEDGFRIGGAINQSTRGSALEEGRSPPREVDNEGSVVPKYEGVSFSVAKMHYLNSLPKRVSYPQSKTGFRLALPAEERSAEGEVAKIYPNPFLVNAEELDEFGT
jgi:hypothetical protein